LPEYYDIAFDFRDLPKECAFLDQMCRSYGQGSPKSVVELGSGPGYHAIHLSNFGNVSRSIGLDLSPEMIEYAKRKNASAGGSAKFILGDMRDYSLDEPVDLAICMMATFHLLLTNEDIIQHFRCVADNLADSGLYIIECTHPNDFFSQDSRTQSEWAFERDGIKVTTKWGSDDDKSDPITQINHTTVTLIVDRQGKRETHSFIEPFRMLTYQELKLLVELSGVFEIVDCFGSVDAKISFNNDKDSWRMVPVLRRV